MPRIRTETIWIGLRRFNYQDGPSSITIWPHGDKTAKWTIERTNCDHASVAAVASARSRYGLIETTQVKAGESGDTAEPNEPAR